MWFRWNNDNEDIHQDYKVFLKYLLVEIAANCETSSESDKLLINERDSECHKADVGGSEVHKADEVSEVRLMGEIDELNEVEDYEVCEVGEAYEWQWAVWGLLRPSNWWVMSWIRLARWSQYYRKSETDEWR